MDTFRRKYKQLSPEDIQYVERVKTKAEELLALYNGNSEVSRAVGFEMQLAITKLRESVMWAVNSITK